MKICPRCGRRMPDNMNFCSECGVRLVQPAPMQPMQQQPARPKKKKKWLLPVVLGVVCAAAAAAGAWYYFVWSNPWVKVSSTYLYSEEWDTTYEYNRDGQLMREIQTCEADPDSNTTTRYTYDADGNCTSKCWYDADDILSSQITYQYDEDGQMIGETSVNQYGDGYGYTYTYTYDDDGNLISQTEAGGFQLRWEYDEDGNMLWEYLYDESGCMTRADEYTYDDEGQAETMVSYTTEGSMDSSTKSYTKQYEYDEKGNLIRETYDYSGSNYTAAVTYTYDEHDLLIRMDGEDEIETYEYQRLRDYLKESGGGYQES